MTSSSRKEVRYEQANAHQRNNAPARPKQPGRSIRTDSPSLPIFIQAEMLRKGYMSLDDLTDEEIDRLIDCDLEGLDIEQLKRKEADND